MAAGNSNRERQQPFILTLFALMFIWFVFEEDIIEYIINLAKQNNCKDILCLIR